VAGFCVGVNIWDFSPGNCASTSVCVGSHLALSISSILTKILLRSGNQ